VSWQSGEAEDLDVHRRTISGLGSRRGGAPRTATPGPRAARLTPPDAERDRRRPGLDASQLGPRDSRAPVTTRPTTGHVAVAASESAECSG